MTDSATNTDKFRAILVLAATVGMIAFNWLAAIGRIDGVTVEQISAKYPTPVTPASYVFTIWAAIYIGLLAFSIYQLVPANLSRFRSIRSIYIFSCALNCAWLYFWHADQIAICLAILLALCLVLLAVNHKLRDSETTGEYWLAKAPFGFYFGWVTVAALLNLAVVLESFGIRRSTLFSVVLILLAAAFGVLARVKLANYFYPLAIAWGLTAIAIKQSGQTAIVTACSIGVVACLIASMSFVVNLPSSETRRS